MLDRLTSANPWWATHASIAQDPHLRARAQAPLHWTPKIAVELVLSTPAIYTIRGPRQVGKTTSLKLMIERSLQEAPDEEVLYYACDLENNPDAIRQVVQTAKRLRPQAQRWRIFLDEVSVIPRWERGVKWLWDNTDARRDTFVATGSSAIDVAGGADQLPGRRGAQSRMDRILLPLSFSDFARVHSVTPPLESRVHQFFDHAVQDQLEQAQLHLPMLQALFERYLHSGGFPTAVTDEHAHGHVSNQTLQMIWDLIENEVQRQRKDPVLAYRTVEHVVRGLGSSTEWTSLGESLGADRRTAEDYARMLALMFSVLILHKLDPKRWGPQLRAQRKLYLVDPLLAYLPRRIRQVAVDPDVPALVENVVMMALFRSEERMLAEDFAVPQMLFYWKSQSGGEVDAIIGRTKQQSAIEVKYKGDVRPKDIAALTRSFPRGVVTTRETFDLSNRNFPRIPVPLFLWVLAGESTVAARTN